MKSHVVCCVLFLTALMAPVALAQVPLGPEFQVNTYTRYNQRRPSVAADAAGNFVVVWDSYGQDGGGGYYGGGAVFVRQFLSSGAPLGGEARVNVWTAGSQVFPAVASAPTGRFAVVWNSIGQDGSMHGVFGRRYDDAGAPGPEFSVNTFTTGYQLWPAVAMDASGKFVVAWESWGQDDAYAGIFAQRYDAAGVPQGPEFRVNSYTSGGQRYPSVGMDAGGNFVVVWVDEQQEGSPGIFAQRYDAAGVAQGGEFRVHSYTTGTQTSPAVSVSSGGDFVVVWQSEFADGDSWGIAGQRYDLTGTPDGGEFRVNTYGTGAQSAPVVAVDPSGRFTVAWTSYRGEYLAFDDVYGRLFDATGAPRGDDSRLNSSANFFQNAPAIASTTDGSFLVAWTGMDGHELGVRANGFAPVPDLIFADDFESGSLAAWSSAATDGGDLAVSVSAALNSSAAGLRALVDDTTGLFVEDGLPDDEDRYRARFYFDTNGFDPGEAQLHRRVRLFVAFEESPTRRLAAIVLRRQGGAYAILGRARLDDDSQYDTGFFPIADAPHFVELAWKRATGPDASDGGFELWIDGVSVHAASTLDNSRSAVDFVRMGALSVKTAAAGTLFWDDFESRRVNYIGP